MFPSRARRTRPFNMRERINIKFIFGFSRFECLSRRYEKDFPASAAASDRGYNPDFRRVRELASCQPTGAHDLQPKLRSRPRHRSNRAETRCEQRALHRDDGTSRACFRDPAGSERQNESANSRTELSERSRLAGAVALAFGRQDHRFSRDRTKQAEHDCAGESRAQRVRAA